MTRIACVLKSGGDYGPADVEKLKAHLDVHLPKAELVCFSDFDPAALPCRTIALEHDWPGWWSKLELFNPAHRGCWHYLDLDMVPVGDLSDFAAIRQVAIMRDVYRPDGLQSAAMVIPQAAKAEIWKAFTGDPEANMQACTVRYSKWGDQGFLEGFWLDKAKRLQDLLPGQIVSYKANRIAASGVPEGARLVAFHGRPRPHEVGW